jgi:hypothetical protein
MTVVEVERLGVEEGGGYLTPADELDWIELGDRVIDDFLNWRVARAYLPECQPHLTIRVLVGTVARDLRVRRGWTPPLIPLEWWSPSAGEYPEVPLAEAEARAEGLPAPLCKWGFGAAGSWRPSRTGPARLVTTPISAA